jgi:hypothetical protein
LALPRILYSTNTWLKWLINTQFSAGRHYVWCSECFDSQKLSAYSAGRLLPPSSNPAYIYRQLIAETRGEDRHGDKIQQQKAVLVGLAASWKAEGHISDEQAREIVVLVDTATFNEWRPLLYVIPTDGLAERIKSVPIAERAGRANEYRILDLHANEFDIVEFH